MQINREPLIVAFDDYDDGNFTNRRAHNDSHNNSRNDSHSRYHSTYAKAKRYSINENIVLLVVLISFKFYLAPF